MIRALVWNESAINSAAGFLEDDPSGLSQLLDSIDRLAADPRPADSREFGTPDLRRLRAGQYRVLYEITEVVTIIHVGRVA